MKAEKVKLSMLVAICLLAGAASAATGSSGEFRIDLRGMEPWERRVARPTEAISYSSAWATNAPAGAKAVVKVYPCLKALSADRIKADYDMISNREFLSYGVVRAGCEEAVK